LIGIASPISILSTFWRPSTCCTNKAGASQSLLISHNNITSEESVCPTKPKHLLKTKKKGVQIKVKQEHPMSKMGRRRLVRSACPFPLAQQQNAPVHHGIRILWPKQTHTHIPYRVGSVLYTSQNKSSDLSRLKHLPLTYALENGTVDVDISWFCWCLCDPLLRTHSFMDICMCVCMGGISISISDFLWRWPAK